MKFCLYTEKLSPHLLPLASEMARVWGTQEVRYVFRGKTDIVQSGYELGGEINGADWVLNRSRDFVEAERWLLGAEILVCELRDLELWEKRIKSGKGLFYTSERWFKPQKFFRIFSKTVYLPGWVRLLCPAYFRMARKACRLFKDSDNILYLANGIYAANDFTLLLEFMSGSVLSLLRGMIIDCEHRPWGRVWSRYGKCRVKDCLDRFRVWGYFVRQSNYRDLTDVRRFRQLQSVRCLWVGRLLDWKCVDVILRAVSECYKKRCNNRQKRKVVLDVYGSGPEESSLKRMADKYNEVIRFSPPVSMEEVRYLMRNHDVYILSSNACEGWGAVVNEALEERMCVFGTYEAGASYMMLPEGNLFHACDWKALEKLLDETNLRSMHIGFWSVAKAVEALNNWYSKRT